MQIDDEITITRLDYLRIEEKIHNYTHRFQQKVYVFTEPMEIHQLSEWNFEIFAHYPNFVKFPPIGLRVFCSF